MSQLFVLSRTWGRMDPVGGYKTQAIDGEYINLLGVDFESVVLAMVVVDATMFDFVSGYHGRVADHVRVVPLRQTVHGTKSRKLRAQISNLLAVCSGVRASDYVAVFMSSLSAIWAALFAKALGKKLLIYSGNDWAVDAALKLRNSPALLRKVGVFVADRLESLVLRIADIRLVNSPQLFAKCEGRKGMVERVRPISRFCLADLYVRDDTCQGDELRIIYPAAVIPRKNHATLLRAFANVRARGVNASLWLAGAVESAQIQQELERQARDLGVGEHVHFLGYVAGKDEMLALLRTSDIFVLPSLNEGFPRVVWEAMLQSLPCAVSRIPNIVADIGHRDVGLMFDPTDADEMADALLRIASDGDLRRKLIMRGREYAQEVFAESWDQQLARMLKAW